MTGYARWTKTGPVSRMVVGITGASGAAYAVRLLEVLKGLDIGADIIISDAGIMVLRHEMEFGRGGVRGEVGSGPTVREAVQAALKAHLDRVAAAGSADFAFHHIMDLMSRVASGSSFPGPMVVVPCTMGTLAAIATGAGHNLIHRAADVALKEGIPLVLVPRETPLSLIHLRNLAAAAEAGAKIVPAMPAFYSRPTSVSEMVDFVVGRILDAVGVEHRLYKTWVAED